MPTPPAHPAAPARPPEADALRAELRCLLLHPAFTPARRLAAEPFMFRCPDPARLRHWVSLTVAECARWEEQALAQEAGTAASDGSCCRNCLH